MKRLIILVLIVGLFFYLIFASNTFQVRTSTEIRHGIEQKVYRFEWRMGNFIPYIKYLAGRIKIRIKYLINNLKQKLSGGLWP